MDDSEFRLQTPERFRLWNSLSLTMSQAATLTGVSERQIQHWMDRGYIGSDRDGSRKLNGRALDTIMLIRQARGAGFSLRRSVEMAAAYLNREERDDLDGAGWAVKDLKTRLEEVRSSIATLEDLLEQPELKRSDGRLVSLSASSGDGVISQGP